MKNIVMRRVSAILAAVLTGSMLLAALAAPTVLAKSHVYLTLNGIPASNPSLKPLMVGNHAYVPIRAMAELAGEAVEWDGIACSVLIRTKPAPLRGAACKGVQLWIDGKRAPAELRPIIRKNTAYVPIRTVTAAFGMPVAWNRVTRSVDVTRKEADSYAAYRLLPDGRYRMESLGDGQNERIEEPVTVSKLRTISPKTLAASEKFEAKVTTGHGDVLLKLQKVKLADRTIVMPQDMNRFPLEFYIAPDGKKSFAAADNGIWLMNGSNNKLQRLSPTTYNGKTYASIAKERQKLHAELYWNGSVTVSPDSTKLLYTSNRNNSSSFGNALYSYDLVTGAEAMVAQTTGADYEVIGWLNAKQVLCVKDHDSVRTTVLVDLTGLERDLDFLDKDPLILAVQDGMVAYFTIREGGDDFHIANVDPTGEIRFTTTVPTRGSTRIRGGQAFSPQSSYVAFLYVPDDEPMARYLKVINVHTKAVTDIDSFPAGVQASAGILEFAWEDDHTLHAVIHEDDSREVPPSKINAMANPGDIRNFLDQHHIANGDLYLQDNKIYVNIVGLTDDVRRLLADRYEAGTYVAVNVRYSIGELTVAQQKLEDNDLYRQWNVYASEVDVLHNKVILSMPESSEAQAKPVIERLIDRAMITYDIHRTDGAPDYTGTIVSVDAELQRILILLDGEQEPGIYFGFNAYSEIYDSELTPLSFDELHTRQKARVWAAGGILLSKPAYGMTQRLEVAD